ncbi:hypothetical protein BH09ACT5_BH09ACT5_08370 [soil metagenome]
MDPKRPRSGDAPRLRKTATVLLLTLGLTGFGTAPALAQISSDAPWAADSTSANAEPSDSPTQAEAGQANGDTAIDPAAGDHVAGSAPTNADASVEPSVPTEGVPTAGVPAEGVPTADLAEPSVASPISALPRWASAASAPVVNAVPAPGSSVDLQAVIAGPSAADGGDPFTYTATFSNNSLTDGDTATFVWTAPAGATNVAAACTAASNGAFCPSSMTVTNAQVAGDLPTMPHLGTVEITITGNFPVGISSVSSSASVTPPPGTTDPDLSTNTSFISTSLSTVTDLSVTKTADQTSVAPGDTVNYTVVYSNTGPTAVNGAAVRDTLQFIGGPEFASTVAVDIQSCVSSGGAVCPTLADDPASTGTIWDTTIPLLPGGGASLTINYSITYTVGDPNGCYSRPDPARFPNSAEAFVPVGVTDTDYSNNQVNYQLTAVVSECPTGSTTSSKTGSSSLIAPGDTVTYSVTYNNTGTVSQDGTAIWDSLRLLGGPEFADTADVHFVSCATTGGAVCPTLADTTVTDSTGFGDDVYDTTIPTYPAGSSVTITYEVFYTPGDPNACYSGQYAAQFYNEATSTPPAGVIDSGTHTDFRSAADVTPCPGVDVSVTKTVGSTRVQPGDTVGYTVTFSNAGPGDASGSQIRDVFTRADGGPSFGTTDIDFTGCTVVGGAVCPTLTDFTTGGQGVFDTTVPSLPASSSITIAYNITYNASATQVCSGNPEAAIPNTANIWPPSTVQVVNPEDDQVVVQTPVKCADVAVNKQVDPIAVQAGDAVTYTVIVSNGGTAAADAIQFTDPLPSGFVYSSASCAALTGAPTCGAVDYDSATNTVSSLIPLVGNGESVVFTIEGTAGVVQGTYANTAEAVDTAASTYWDPNPVTNSSRVNLQLFNTTSDITVTKTIAGFAGAGLEEAMTFTGEVTCGTQAPQAWSATVPAGALSASAAPLTFFDTEQCTVTEDTPPAAPAAYEWAAGSPTIAPSVIPALGPSTPVTVDVTNTLRRLSPDVVPAAVQPVLAYTGIAVGSTITLGVTLFGIGVLLAAPKRRRPVRG